VRKLLPGVFEESPDNLVFKKPMGYALFTTMLAGARGIITDSGGLVEEAATLGVPTIILRAHNDRPEAVSAGIARQFPPTAEGIKDAAGILQTEAIKRKPTAVYGTMDSALEIARHLGSLI
jgi:UDP-N-acetylglucosamine 2-epimerase